MSAPNLNLFVKFLTASSLASSLFTLSNRVGKSKPINSFNASMSPNVPMSSVSATIPAPTPPPIPMAMYLFLPDNLFNSFAFSKALTMFLFGLATFPTLAAFI